MRKIQLSREEDITLEAHVDTIVQGDVHIIVRLCTNSGDSASKSSRKRPPISHIVDIGDRRPGGPRAALASQERVVADQMHISEIKKAASASRFKDVETIHGPGFILTGKAVNCENRTRRDFIQ